MSASLVHHTADVLVIGGGLAGAWAALSAAKSGASVVLVDKGYCGSSGVTATAGVGHWYLPADRRDAEVAQRLEAGGQLNDPAWMHRTMQVAWERLPELDRHYPWPITPDGPDRSTTVRGPEYMRLMRGRVRRAGVRILDHHPAIELTERADGSVGGATGVTLQPPGYWRVDAAAVILGTGGTSYLSRTLGSNNNTGDGYLMAAELGVEGSGFEFSSYYTVTAAFSSMARSIPFMYGRYFDCDGHEIKIGARAQSTTLIAQALLRGPVTCTLERMPEATRTRLPHVQPNFLLPLLRNQIDPFTQRFPITLRGEGTIRGSGGLLVADSDCQSSVDGLYVVGDVADRQPLVGAASGGGAPNSAWCIASGTWAGRAAARRSVRVRPSAAARGRVAWAGKRADPDISPVRKVVTHELNAYDKNLFRTQTGLSATQAVLEEGWDHIADTHTSSPYDRLRLRETAAMVLAARWTVAAALGRPESRGLHQRLDKPTTDPRFCARTVTGGLDEVYLRSTELSAAS